MAELQRILSSSSHIPSNPVSIVLALVMVRFLNVILLAEINSIPLEPMLLKTPPEPSVVPVPVISNDPVVLFILIPYEALEEDTDFRIISNNEFWILIAIPPVFAIATSLINKEVEFTLVNDVPLVLLIFTP